MNEGKPDLKFFGGELLASPTVLWVVVKYLRFRGMEAITREELANRLRPPGRADPSGALKASIKIGKGLGILIEDTDGIRLERDVSGRDALWSGEFWPFGNELLTRVLRHAQDAVERGEKSSDLAAGIVWLMHRDPRDLLPDSDPFRVGGGMRELQLEQELRDAGVGIDNKEKWSAFIRWTTALQVVKPTAGYLTPDASQPLRELIGGDLINQDARTFCQDIASKFPVFMGTRLSRSVMGEARSASDIPPAVGYSLARLEQVGVLQLRFRADSPETFKILYGSSTREFTHVTRVHS